MSDFPGFKIKRNSRKYQTKKQRRFAAVKTVASVLGFFALFFIGYSVAEPVVSFINGEMRARVDSEYEASQASSQASSSQPAESSRAPGQGIGLHDIKAAYMPPDVLINDDRFNEFIAQAKAKGVNTAVIEVKDRSGILYYDSSVAEANSIGAVVEDAPKLSARIEALTAEGIQTIARMSTFEDPLAARKIKGTAARYTKDVTSVWLDNYAEEGGKPWINPESAEGVDYISSLIGELAEDGAAYVMAETLHYPKGQALNLAYFGPKSNDSRINVLNDVITRLTGALAETNCKLILSYDAQDYLTDDAMVYGGSPADLSGEIIAPVILPDAFEKELTIGTTTVTDPALQPYDITKAFTEELQDDIAQGTELLPFVEYNNASGVQTEQLRALSELSVAPYILYAPDGRYE